MKIADLSAFLLVKILNQLLFSLCYIIEKINVLGVINYEENKCP